jgi:hypothetical protein
MASSSTIVVLFEALSATSARLRMQVFPGCVAPGVGLLTDTHCHSKFAWIIIQTPQVRSYFQLR